MRVRISWIVGGALLALTGLVVTIIGAVVLLVRHTAASIDPDAEGRTPGSATFVAEDATYDVLYVGSRRDSAASADDFTCEVSLANERNVTLDGSSQSSSVKAANVEMIGSFHAVAGRTEVFCAAGDRSNRFVIDRRSSLSPRRQRLGHRWCHRTLARRRADPRRHLLEASAAARPVAHPALSRVLPASAPAGPPSSQPQISFNARFRSCDSGLMYETR